jgi:hypothetical protein
LGAHAWLVHVKLPLPQSEGCVHVAAAQRCVVESQERPAPQSAAVEQPGTQSDSGTAPPLEHQHGPGLAEPLQIIPVPASAQSASAWHVVGPFRGWQEPAHIGARSVRPQ